jgi:hypothetical protein
MTTTQIIAWLQDLLFELDGGALYTNAATRAHLDAIDAVIAGMKQPAVVEIWSAGEVHTRPHPLVTVQIREGRLL